MASQFVDSACTAVSTINDTYNITSSNNQFSVSIDGGSAQVFSLTIGSTRTAANIVSDLSGLTGAVASVVTINSQNFVCITDNTSNGVSSTILFNAPSNNSNTVLGFVATTYTGGQNVNAVYIGDTKANLANGLETQLNNAGWVTVANHQTPTASSPGVGGIVLMSQMTQPGTQSLRMRLHIKDNGNNCIVLSIANVSEGKAGASTTGAGGQLYPHTGKQWRVVANKYQAFIMCAGGQDTTNSRDYVGFGVPYLPSFLQGSSQIYEAAWLNGASVTDTDTGFRGCFRCCLGSWGGVAQQNNYYHGNSQHLCNGNLWEINSSNYSTNPPYAGSITLITLNAAIIYTQGAYWYRWHDGSTFMSDPIIAWGTSSTSTASTGKGLLWDAFISSEVFQGDTKLSSINGKNWLAITHFNQGGSNPWNRGTLFVVVP